MSVADLICPMCGTESTDETQELFAAECNCCHRDFCEECVEIIQKNIDNKCDFCSMHCESKCIRGSDESDSDDESMSDECYVCEKQKSVGLYVADDCKDRKWLCSECFKKSLKSSK